MHALGLVFSATACGAHRSTPSGQEGRAFPREVCCRREWQVSQWARWRDRVELSGQPERRLFLAAYRLRTWHERWPAYGAHINALHISRICPGRVPGIRRTEPSGGLL
jgi:hypothetical protein